MSLYYTPFRTILAIALLLLTCSCGATDKASDRSPYEELSPFAVSYEKVLPEQVAGYDLIIIEPNHYNKLEVENLKSTGTKVLAYVSLGEVNPGRWYYPILEERGFLGKNENWNSYFINLADSVSYNLFTDQVFPELALRGYDGFFLDTVDAVAPYTPRNHLEPYMVNMINGLRNSYPDHIVIQNAGLFLLNRTAASLNAVLIEDVATSYDFKNSAYGLKDEASYAEKTNRINQLAHDNDMPFLILDFAIEQNVRTEAINRLDQLAYPYFISRIELNDISSGISGNHY